MTKLTIVFIDLTGSTGIFEELGNAKATEIVTRATQWVGKLCSLRGGRVIKYLGDGVLVAFSDPRAATQTAVEIQTLHSERLQSWPEKIRMKLRVGLAWGDVLEQEGDCFGDAVNLAARLSDLAGSDQILATESVIEQLPLDTDLRYRNLGPINIRGRSESLTVYRVEWQREQSSEFMTIQATLESVDSTTLEKPALSLNLTCLDVNATFQAEDLPFYLGRAADARFMIDDPRVSRLHARIESRGDTCILEDVSSYGTWVHFADSNAVIALRRQECVLYGKGEISLGTSFEDISAPTISFTITTLGQVRARR